jgi:hypothetical protein
MKYLVTLLALSVLTGCAALNKEVAPRVAKAVNHYCLEPLPTRQLIRGQVNAMVAPNAVKVTCAGDPE